MKILAFGVNSPDYMQDDVYHGLVSLFGRYVEANVNLSYLYDDYPGDISLLYGRGISYAKNLKAADRVVVDRLQILEHLRSGYYDAVVYLSQRRCLDLFDSVMNYVNPAHVAVIDGEDDPILYYIDKVIQFKRELVIPPSDNLFPISFAIPFEKICPFDPIKLRDMSEQVPNMERKYTFTDEDSYYAEYRSSRYAITCCKGGWDCKRHYEILANKCVPVFKRISDCPTWTMTTMPKTLFADIEKHYSTANPSQYWSWYDYLSEYVHSLTTTRLAKYVIDKVI